MNKSLEVQKLVIQSVKTIEYINTNKVQVFSSVPMFAKMPYIKLAGLSTENIGLDIQRFTIDLFVATNGKNNKQILEIMEELYNNLPEKMNNYLAENQNDFSIIIQDVFTANFNITEDLRNDIWCGHYNIQIDIC